MGPFFGENQDRIDLEKAMIMSNRWKARRVGLRMAVGLMSGLFSFGLFMCGVPLSTQAMEDLTLSEALRLGKLNGLRANENSEGAAYYRERERERWRRRYLPSLTLAGTTEKDNLSGDPSESQLEARVNYLIYAGGRHRAGHLAAQNAGRADALEQRETWAVLELQIAERFFDLLSSHRRLESLQLAVERAERDHRNMARRRELGLRTKLEVLQARLALEDERFNLLSEERTRDEHAQFLSHLIRKPVTPDRNLRVEALRKADPKSVDYYVQAALDNHWELSGLESRMEESRQGLKAQQGARRPEVLLSTVVTDPEGEAFTTKVALSLTYRFGGHSSQVLQEETRGKSSGTSLSLSGGQWVSRSTVNEESTSSTSLGVTFFDFSDPTFDQSSREAFARIDHARAGRLLIEAREARIREVTLRYHALERAKARWVLEGLRVEKNEKELAAYKASYQAGSVPYEDVVERQTALTRGRVSNITARGDVMQAWVALLNASALPLLSEIPLSEIP